MTKLVLIGYLVAIATVSTSLTAQPSKSATLESPTNAQTSTEPSATVANDSSALPHVRASDSLLTSIVTWLSTNFELEPTPLLPQVKYVSASAITERRNRAFLGASGQPASPPDAGRTTVAVYDHGEATIYLPADWTGNTPSELSVLVHEMVHHLQSVARTKFECPQAREQLAYAAQQRWLSLFGRTLEDEFQLDPFTLLVTTRCMY